MTWEAIAVVLVIAMVPFATANPIMYAYVANWRKSKEGRATMWAWVGLALLVDFAVFYTLVPTFPGKGLVAVVVYALLLIGFIRFTAILVRALRAQHRAD